MLFREGSQIHSAVISYHIAKALILRLFDRDATPELGFVILFSFGAVEFYSRSLSVSSKLQFKDL